MAGSLWLVPSEYEELVAPLERGNTSATGLLRVAFYGPPVSTAAGHEETYGFVPLEGHYCSIVQELLEAVSSIQRNENAYVERRSVYAAFTQTTDEDEDEVHVGQCYSESAVQNLDERSYDHTDTVTLSRASAIRGILEGAELIYRVAEDAYAADETNAKFDALDEDEEWATYRDMLDELQAEYRPDG